MKTVILAGGFGLRLSDKTVRCPKPMVRVGGIPMLEHIMGIYSNFGFKDFVFALGYKQEVISDYFLNREADVSVELIDTGLETMTGGRIKRLKNIVGESTFMMTYGDGVADIDISSLLAFHKHHGRLATITAVRPPARFGCLHLDGNRVECFNEKPQAEEGWINGGFFVLEPEVIDYIEGDSTVWERDPLESLARDNELMAFFHEGFWQPMDNLREHKRLEELWAAGHAPWAHSINSELQAVR